MSKTFQKPDKSFFQESKELGDLINKGNLVCKYIPKQTNIDKNIKSDSKKGVKRHTFTG